MDPIEYLRNKYDTREQADFNVKRRAAYFVKQICQLKTEK
jgi:hypothetical protein